MYNSFLEGGERDRIRECEPWGLTAGYNCHLLQLRLQQQEERKKRGEIIRVDWSFSCGKCSVIAARQHTRFIF